MRSLVVATAVGLACLTSAPAQAADEENAVSVFLGYGTYAIPDYRPDGGVLAVEYERGFSDALWWRMSGGLGVYHGDGLLTYSGHATAGLTYLFDVLEYVPYLNVGLGAIYLTGGDEPGVSALIELGVGLDILRSRSFSYGVQIRFETLLQQTSFLTAGLRATWRWGFF